MRMRICAYDKYDVRKIPVGNLLLIIWTIRAFPNLYIRDRLDMIRWKIPRILLPGSQT